MNIPILSREKLGCFARGRQQQRSGLFHRKPSSRHVQVPAISRWPLPRLVGNIVMPKCVVPRYFTWMKTLITGPLSRATNAGCCMLNICWYTDAFN